MKLTRKKKLVWLVVAGGVLILYLGFGPLFAWNPVHPFYSVTETAKAVVMIRDPSRLDPCFKDIDRIMAKAEQFCNLRFHQKVKVIVCLNEFEKRRLVPWMKMPAGVSLQIGDVVYLYPPKILEHGYPVAQYLRHELNHSLIYQNAHIWNSFQMSRQAWVVEGAAEVFGGPYYYTKPEFTKLFQQHHLIFQENRNHLYPNLDPQDPKFNYSLYRFFVAYLIESYGLPAFQNFLHQYLAAPAEVQALFQQTFHLPLSEALAHFSASLIPDTPPSEK